MPSALLTHASREPQPSRLRSLSLAALLAVLAAGPFFQGLFFPPPFLAALFLVSLSFSVWLVAARRQGAPVDIPGGAEGAALLLLLVCYLLQFFWALYPRGNIDATLQVAAGWFVFVMMRSAGGDRLGRGLCLTLAASAVTLGAAGFLELSGFLPAPSSDTFSGADGRTATPLQYPNTAAIYYLAAILALFGLALEDLRPRKLAAAAAAAAFLGLSFFFAVSRGALLVLPVGGALLLAGLDGARRRAALLLMACSLFPVLLAAAPAASLFSSGNPAAALACVLCATAAGGAAGGASALFCGSRRRMYPAGLAASGAVVVTAAVAATLFFAPKQAARFSDVGFTTNSVAMRLMYDRDALRIVADHPAGLGGGGWERSYRRYQEIGYTSLLPHNHYLQTAVEAGGAGAVLLAAAIFLAVAGAWRRREKPGAWGMAAGAAVIALHSAIDFDLSFGAVWLLLWGLLGAAGSGRLEQRDRGFSVAAAAGGGAAVVAATLLAASLYTAKAERLASQGRVEEARVAARTAGCLDPWNPSPRAATGERSALEKAVLLDPDRAELQWRLAQARELDGDLQGARSAARRAVTAAPFTSRYYDTLASVAGTLMVGALRDGRRGDALQWAAELVALEREREERASRGARLQMPEGIPSSPLFRCRIGEALVVSGNAASAEEYLAAAPLPGLLAPERDLFLYAVFQRSRNAEGMQRLEQKPWIRFRRHNPLFAALERW